MQPKTWKEWEKPKPVVELEAGIEKLRQKLPAAPTKEARDALEAQIREYEGALEQFTNHLYAHLGPWEEVLVARADPRPYSLDYIGQIFSNFVELQGDRCGNVDNAIIGGPALMDGRPVMVLGHQKGRNATERVYRNFGMAKPEGYRKAIRLMEMAGRFGLPVVTFVDTPAADPGVASEQRGISEAIAAAMLAMFGLKVPVVSVVIGEGGSGGAIGIACGNRVLMLEHAIYSVIPPEGCAAILWRDPEKGPQAAQALRLTAKDADRLGLIDEILPEPQGGAHRNPGEAAQTVKEAIVRHLTELDKFTPAEVHADRQRKFREMGLALASAQP